MKVCMVEVTNIFKRHFIQSSFIVLIGSSVVNILNYAFNLVMGRILGPAQFGKLASLFALVVIMEVPSITLTKLVAKYAAEYKAKNQINLINDLFKLITRYSLAIGSAVLLLFWIFIPFLNSFLKIEKLPLFIFGLLFPISLIVASNRGALQGLQQFVSFSLIDVIATVLKFILSILLFILGFSISGVMIALVIGALTSFLYGVIKVKSYLINDQSLQKEVMKSQVVWKEIFSYAPIIFWTMLLLALFTNIDVVLAKHYLSPYFAGQYSALSITGKIIVYGSGAFITVMFPKVAASNVNCDAKGKDLLKTSFGIVLAVSLLLLLLFVGFPEFTISMLFGTKYLSVAPYLKWFGLAMFFGTLATVFINYFIATHKKIFIYPLVFITISQIFLIILFHQNIFEITISVLVSSLLMMVSMSMIYFREVSIIKNI